MKRQVTALALLLMPLAAMEAQDIDGTWQATIEGARSVREIVTIVKTETGLRGVLYNLDQGVQASPIDSITVQDHRITVVIGAINGNYNGTVDDTATIMSGEWTQGSTAITVVFERVPEAIAWPLPSAMSETADPTFKTVIITSTPAATITKAIQVSNSRRLLRVVNTSLRELLAFAYGVHALQIQGGPEWAATERFSIEAEAGGEGIPSETQWRLMTQKLLADRFQVRIHKDHMELDAYTIEISADGPKLSPSGISNGLVGLRTQGLGKVVGMGVDLSEFARFLQTVVLDGPVVEATGLPGKVDFVLAWAPDATQFNGIVAKVPLQPEVASRPDLFAAFRQQLGLTLEIRRQTVEVISIDNAIRPITR